MRTLPLLVATASLTLLLAPAAAADFCLGGAGDYIALPPATGVFCPPVESANLLVAGGLGARDGFSRFDVQVQDDLFADPFLVVCGYRDGQLTAAGSGSSGVSVTGNMDHAVAWVLPLAADGNGVHGGSTGHITMQAFCD